MKSTLTNKRSLLSASAVALALTLSIGPCAADSKDKPGPGAGRPQTALAVRGKFIDERIADFMAKNNLPGLTMAIVQAPYVPRSAGYGRASITNDELASTRTMWNIGPITQGFTAVAIFQLYEAHKLDIHDAIERYVPGIPAAWGKITIFELLQHASGIPDYRRSTDFNETQKYRPADLLALVASKPLLFKSGAEVHMSATDFILLGLAIERASGMSFREYVTKFQIEPLGLRSTMFAEDFPAKSFLDRPSQDTTANEHVRFKSEIPYIDPVEPAVGYREEKGKLVAVDGKSSESLFALGAIWSSAEDISVWDTALAGRTLVKSLEDHALIYQPTKLENGTTVPAMAGWEFTHHPGFMEVKGSSPGFSSYLSRFTAASELVCVTLLTNKEGVDLTGLARDIAEAYLAGLGAPIDTDKIVTRESKYSVDETVVRLESQLKSMYIPIFATFDHSENARKAELQLRPTKVLVFGNAKVGTKLMLDNQAIALDLPLRLLIWEDERGRVWVSYHSMDHLADEYDIKDSGTVQSLSNALEGLVGKAVNVYDY
jgi:CubicO group peptidase (beta-lactamase class C family)/uncharacterized protein (DUF302 family)